MNVATEVPRSQYVLLSSCGKNMDLFKSADLF